VKLPFFITAFVGDNRIIWLPLAVEKTHNLYGRRPEVPAGGRHPHLWTGEASPQKHAGHCGIRRRCRTRRHQSPARKLGTARATRTRRTTGQAQTQARGTQAFSSENTPARTPPGATPRRHRPHRNHPQAPRTAAAKTLPISTPARWRKCARASSGPKYYTGNTDRKRKPAGTKTEQQF